MRNFKVNEIIMVDSDKSEARIGTIIDAYSTRILVKMSNNDIIFISKDEANKLS